MFGEILKTAGFLGMIFILKILENMFDSGRVILLQKRHGVLAGICLVCCLFINYYVLRFIANSEGDSVLIVAAIGAGIGCVLASRISGKFVRTVYVDVIMSDDMNAIREIHNFLTNEHVKHKVEETYNKDLTEKTLTITAFSTTLGKRKKLKDFIKNSSTKFGVVTLQ